MSLKRLVNTPEIYTPFLEHLSLVIAARQRSLEQATDLNVIYRLQGGITELRRMQALRDEVNYKDTSHG